MTTPAEPGLEPARLLVRYPIEQVDLPNQQAANYFHFAQLGGDFQLSIGVLDPALAAVLRNTGDPIEPRLSNRFLMSAQSLQLLHRQVSDIMKKTNIAAMADNIIEDVG